MMTGSLSCRKQYVKDQPACLLVMSALLKKKNPDENNNLNNVRFESDVELLALNTLLLLHLLLPYAFFTQAE